MDLKALSNLQAGDQVYLTFPHKTKPPYQLMQIVSLKHTKSTTAVTALVHGVQLTLDPRPKQLKVQMANFTPLCNT